MVLCLLALASHAAKGETAHGDAGLELETCELLVPGTPLSVVGECGWLNVAENPDEPDGRRIDIHVARIPARGRVSEPDPLVFFAGGPGQAATETWPLVAQALRKVNENRDILLVDQRGTGQSNPLTKRWPRTGANWPARPASASSRWTATPAFTRRPSPCTTSTRRAPRWATKP